MQENKNNNSVNLVDLFFYLLGHWYWFLICVAICVGYAYYSYSKQQHLFRSDATIIIKDPSNTRSTVQLGTYSNLINHVSMSNEILQLQSRALMTEVVRALDADIDYIARDKLRDVELYSIAPVRLFLNRGESDAAQFELKLTPEDASTVSVREGEGAPMRVALGDSVSVCGYPAVFRPTPAYNEHLGETITIRKHSATSAAGALLSRLKVFQTESDGSILQLSLMDYSFRRADDVLNTLVEKYNEDALREKNRIAVNTASFINERLVIIQDELGSVEDDLARFKSSEKIMNVESAATDYLSKSKEFSDEILNVETRISRIRFLRDFVMSAFRTYETIPINTDQDDDRIDAAIASYNTQVRERERLLKAGSESSPAVQQAETGLLAIREDILGYIDNRLSALDKRKADLASREQESLRRFTVMPTKARELLSIERQQKIKEDLYMFLLNKREENALTQAMADNNARMIDTATSSWSPVYPSRNKMLLLAFLIGLLIPAAVLIIRLLADNRVHTRMDIEDGTNMPFLSEIPFAEEKKKKKKDKTEEQKLTTAYTNAKSKIFTEAMRLMCTNIDYMKPEGWPRLPSRSPPARPSSPPTSPCASPTRSGGSC